MRVRNLGWGLLAICGIVLSATLKKFGRTELIRAKEIRFICAKLSTGRAKDLPTVLLGDFNSIPVMNAPLFLTSKGFIDGFASVTEKPDEYPGWHWPTGRGELRLRLDYVWHDANVRTRSAKVLVEGPSDHCRWSASWNCWTTRRTGRRAELDGFRRGGL